MGNTPYILWSGAGHGPLGQLLMDYAREAAASVLNTGHGTMQARRQTFSKVLLMPAARASSWRA